MKRERDGSERGGLSWPGEEERSLWSSRIYTTEKTDGRSWGIPPGRGMLPAGRPFWLKSLK